MRGSTCGPCCNVASSIDSKHVRAAVLCSTYGTPRPLEDVLSVPRTWSTYACHMPSYQYSRSGARHEIAMRDLIVSLQLPLTVAEHVPPLTVTQSTLSQSFQPTTPTINFPQSYSTCLSHRDPIGKAVLGRFSLVTWADIMEAVVMQVVAGRTNRRLRATSARLRRFAIQASRC